MESLLDDESPLAQALLEGIHRPPVQVFRMNRKLTDFFVVTTADGQGELSMTSGGHPSSSQTSRDTTTTHDYAPHPSSLHARLRQRLGRPLKIVVPKKGPVAIIQDACSVRSFASYPTTRECGSKMSTDAPLDLQDAVSSTIQRRDNEQFLDAFRYSIVTSNLLHDHTAATTLRIPSPTQQNAPSIPSAKSTISWSVDGIVLTAAAGALFAWMLQWTLSASSLWIEALRLTLLILVIFVAIQLLVAYTSRQRLRHMRQEALESVNVSLVNFDAFDRSSSAAITLIQEVEAVSRGYHLYVLKHSMHRSID
jgi:vezatin